MNTNLLNRLHKIAMFFEDNNNEIVADQLHEVFVKLSKKKKKKSGKNVPNDPELYARCKAETKKKFKTWPSAYGSMALAKLYKSRGGTYRSE